MTEANAPGRLTTSRTDPDRYASPDTQYLSSGAPLSAVLPPRMGMSGLVVPQATADGGLSGFDPHRPQRVIIDPGPNGQGFEIDLSQITKEDTIAATANGQTVRSAGSAEKTRDASVDCLRRMAKLAEARMTAPVPPEDVSSPPMYAAPELSATAVPRYATVSPRQAAMQPSVTPVPLPAAPPAVEAPAEAVVFEVDGFGTFEASYHVVVRAGDCLLLAMDRRYRGGVRYFPPDMGEKYLFLDVASHAEVYVVRSLGLMVPFQNYDLCLLLIQQAVAKNPSQEF